MKKRINSRAKGKAGELELAHFLVDRGMPARRGQQFKGGAGSADVVCPALQLAGFHIECKRVQSGNPYTWLDQAVRDAPGLRPLVCHRKDRREWLAIVRLEDFLQLVKEAGL